MRRLLARVTGIVRSRRSYMASSLHNQASTPMTRTLRSKNGGSGSAHQYAFDYDLDDVDSLPPTPELANGTPWPMTAVPAELADLDSGPEDRPTPYAPYAFLDGRDSQDSIDADLTEPVPLLEQHLDPVPDHRAAGGRDRHPHADGSRRPRRPRRRHRRLGGRPSCQERVVTHTGSTDPAAVGPPEHGFVRSAGRDHLVSDLERRLLPRGCGGRCSIGPATASSAGAARVPDAAARRDGSGRADGCVGRGRPRRASSRGGPSRRPPPRAGSPAGSRSPCSRPRSPASACSSAWAASEPGPRRRQEKPSSRPPW